MQRMAQTYIIPEEENKKITETLGRDIEMQTFKTNAKPDLTTCNSCSNDKPEVKHGGQAGSKVVKLVCCGDYSGIEKYVYINDYLGTRPPVKAGYRPCVFLDFCLKCLNWKCKLCNTDYQIKLHIWQIPEWERDISKYSTVIFKGTAVAMVIWGARSESLESALKWKEVIVKATNSYVPIVLMVENISRSSPPASWLGSGMLMNSREAMDEFCVEHGFIAWFEMRSRDWESGERSVFGQAVSRLLDEVTNHKESKFCSCCSG